MNNHELLATIRNRDQQIHRLRAQLQNRASVNYEQKYKKALRSIEDIIKANRQIKQELDNLRAMRQAEHVSLGQVQREQFQKSYDAILKEKNALISQLQSLELQNQKLNYTISDLENQLQNYKAQQYSNYDKISKPQVNSNQLSQPLAVISNHIVKQGQNKEQTESWRQKQAQFHRTLQSYEDHNSNLSRINKRLQEKVSELENKVINTEKQWRNKLDTKELELIDAKSQIRQEFTEQVSALRKENSNLKVANNDLSIKLQTTEKNVNYNYQPKFDWEADLVTEMIAIKSNLQPLRQQISQLQEVNIYEKEQSVRERTNLRTQVLELQAQVQRQTETIKTLQKKIVDSHQQTLALEQKSSHLRRLQEQNELLQGRMIVMQSREVALRNRSGQELQQRVLEFENRVQLLLSNKQGLRQLKQINIHQLLALKAYIMELDSKIKELLSSNNYLTKKYKSYKQKYQLSLKEQKTFNVTINSLKMKILGYDKLVLKLQEELEYNIRQNETEMYQVHTVKTTANEESSELYKKKYQMIKEKLEIQEKYKMQEMETLKLNYETKIMELAIQLDQMRSLKETLQLYRLKNEELQLLLTKKQSEVYEARISQPLKGSGISMTEQQSNIRQTKDIINNLHLTIKQSDETIFKLQTQLRNKEQNYKKIISRLERQLNDIQERHSRQSNKKDIEKNLEYDSEVKKYKNKISDLEHELHLMKINHHDEYNKKTDNFDFKLKQLEQRVQQAQEQRQEQIFIKRRVEKQNLALTVDKEELEATVRDLQSKLQAMKQLERENFELKYQTSSVSRPDTTYLDFELQSKDNTIRQLKNQLQQLRSNQDSFNDKDITINSLRNEIFHLKQQIQDHNDTITRYNSEISMLKTHVDSNKFSFNTGLEGMLQDKDTTINKLRKQITNKDFRITELQQDNNSVQEQLRRARRDLSQMEYLRQELDSKERVLTEKSSYGDKLRFELSGNEQEIQRYKREVAYLKENNQKMSNELLEKEDELSRLRMELSTSTVRNKEQMQSRLRDELEQRDRQFNKLNSDYNNIKSTLTLLEDEKQYQEDSYRRATNELTTLRSQVSQLQDQNTSLADQIYYKNQEVSKMSMSVQNSQMLQDELTQKDGELAKMRAQLFALKTSTSALEDEIYQKEASYSRLMKQLSYVREQYNQLQLQHGNKQQSYNRLTQELNSLRREQDQQFSVTQEKDLAISRLTMEVNNYKNKYHQLQEEMEERQQQFTTYCNEIAQLKSNISFHQDEVDDKQNQISRALAERDNLRNQIVTLNEQITEKNMEVNRLKQEIFAIRMEISQNQYDQQFKQEQEIMSYRSKITMLEHQVQDKDAQIRRLGIELETSRYKPSTYTPEISEEQVQELRNEVNKKQRELISMKFELDDRVYQAESATNTINMLKQTISEVQQTQEDDRNEFDRMIREASGRERRINDQLINMREELQRQVLLSQSQKPKSYTITYSEQEMAQIQDRLAQKQAEIIQMRNGEQEKQFYIQNLEAKIQMQERLIGQLEQQALEDQERVEGQIQEYIRRERQLRNAVTVLQLGQHEGRQESHVSTISQGQGQEHHVQGRMYLQEIDRLNNIIQQLQDQVESFKLKLSSMINQQARIEQNLVTMVLLMTEIEALRERVKAKESEINEVRKSFIQMAVAGELENNKMSKLMDLAHEQHSQEQFSHQRLENESLDRNGSNYITNTFDSTNQQISQIPSVDNFTREQYSAAPVEANYEKGFRKEQSNYHQHQAFHISKQETTQVNYNPFERSELQLNNQQSQLPPGAGSQRYMDNYYQNPVILQQRELEEQQAEQRRQQQAYQEQIKRKREQAEGQVEQRGEERIEQQQIQQVRKQDRKESFINQLQKEQYYEQAQPQQVQQAQPQPQPIIHQQIQPQQQISQAQQNQPPQTLTQSRSSKGQITITIQNPSQLGLSRSQHSEPNRMFQQPSHHSMVAQGPQHIRTQQQRQSYHMGQQGPFQHISNSPGQPNVVRVSPNQTVFYPQGASPAHYRPAY